jgi:hypothetical protein
VVGSVVVIATHKNPTTGNVSTGRPSTTVLGTRPPVAPSTKTPDATSPGTTANQSASVPGTHILFDIRGSGDDTIGRFPIDTTAKHWDVNWSYSCSKLGKEAGFNYTVVIVQLARADINDLGPSQTGMSGSGIRRYHDTGTFGITVATECSWTIELSETNP